MTSRDEIIDALKRVAGFNPASEVADSIRNAIGLEIIRDHINSVLHVRCDRDVFRIELPPMALGVAQ